MESKIEKIEGAYDIPILKDKLNKIIDHLNSQDQEEDEPEKVYVDPIVPNFTGELSAPVEYKTREEIADNLQAQFEYGRHGTYKDLESARKEFDKERVKEWDRTAMETYKQATQDAPEEWRELFAEWGLWSLVEDISDDGDGHGDNLQLTKEGREAYRMIKGLLEERECRAREERRGRSLYTKGHKKWKATIRPATKDIGNMKPYTN